MRLDPKRGRYLFVAIVLMVCSAEAEGAPLRLGILGDSISAGNGSSWGENPNWHTQLSNANVTTVTSNQAFGGAITDNLEGQVLSLSPAIGLGTVDAAVLIMGGNDAVEWLYQLYFGQDPTPLIDYAVADIQNSVIAMSKAGVTRQVIATIPDVTVTPLVRDFAVTYGVSPSKLATAANAISNANAQLLTFARNMNIPVIDLEGMSQDIADHPPLTLAGVGFPNLFTPDGFHPSPVLQGLIANAVVDALNRQYGTNLNPLSDQQIVTNAGLIPTVAGPSYFNVQPYVLVPEPSAARLGLVGVVICFAFYRRFKGSAAENSQPLV